MNFLEKQQVEPLVTTDNFLIRAKYDLTLNEKRFICLAISKVDPIKKWNPDKPLTVTIRKDDWIKWFGDENPWRALKRNSKSLMSRQVTMYPNQKNQVIFQWFDEVRYDDDSASVTVIFGRRMSTMLSGLSAEFTQYKLREMAPFTSFSGVRLYELITSFKSTGFLSISLRDFRAFMFCENKYLAMCDLKKRVIEPAIAQIKEHCGETVEYDNVKSGREVIGFKFYIKAKKGAKHDKG